MADLYTNLTKPQLILKCKELGISGYSGKNKADIIALLPKNIPVAILPVKPKKSKNNLKFIDLFCGIGGFHQALTTTNKSVCDIPNINGECVMACDIDEKCREVYMKNYGIMPDSDITTIDVSAIPDFEILTAGFPCQSYSNAGKKKGMGEARGNLFEYILKIAEEKKPSFMFLENVKHIKKIDDGKVFAHILSRIQETGYYVDAQDSVFELSPHEFGIPQHRERVIFVCIRQDIYNSKIKLHIIAPNLPINLEAIIETDTDPKYHISKEVEDILTAWDEMVQIFEVGQGMSPTIMANEMYKKYTDVEFKALPKWKQDYITKNKPLYEKYKNHWDSWYHKHEPLLTSREIYGKLEWQTGKKKKDDSIWNYFIQLRQSGIRVKKSDYFPALVAIVQTPIYAKEKRHITPRECARLQSFPDSFIMHPNDKVSYKQFGNSVNVDIIRFVIQKTLFAYNWI